MCGLPRLCRLKCIFSAEDVPATPSIPLPRFAPLPLETPEKIVHDALLALCDRNPKHMASLIHERDEEPVRYFRTIVHLVQQETWLKKADIEAMLQDSLGWNVASGFVVPTNVAEELRNLRSVQEAAQAANNRAQSAPRRTKVLIGPPIGHAIAHLSSCALVWIAGAGPQKQNPDDRASRAGSRSIDFLCNLLIIVL